MKIKSMIYVVMASVFCANLLFAELVTDGGFDATTAFDGWNNAAGCGIFAPVVVAPMSGNVAWFNAGNIVQTFVGTKLLPNRIYIVRMDSHAGPGATASFIAKLGYGNGSGNSSALLAGAAQNLNAADTTSITVSNGTYTAPWITFNSPDRNVATPATIFHEFKFTTPATITGSTTDDLALRVGQSTAGQAWIDNISVEVLPEPASLGLLVILGLAFLRSK